jgi:hypothetical protein
MNNVQIRKLNKYRSEQAYMTDNAADFPRDSPGDKTAKRLTNAITQIESLAGRQTSQAARHHIGNKAQALGRMIGLLQNINRSAAALADEIEGLGRLFRLPRNRSESNWLTTARAFYEDAAPFETVFPDAELPAGFRADLLDLIEEVERETTAANVAREQRGGATGGLRTEFQSAGAISRRLDAIVRNKYKNDARLLAAWMIASHLEAAPKRKEAVQTPAAS